MENDLSPYPLSDSPDEALIKAFEELIEGWPRDGRDARGDRTGGPQFVSAGACPDPGAWVLLLNGEAGAPEVDRLLAHAAECGACAERMRLMQTDATPEEAAEVAQAASSTPEWQHRLAVELARTPRHKVVVAWPRRYLWAGAALAASLAIVATGLVWWRQANTPENLLAEAYTHSRIYDLRMPGARFAEVSPQMHLRGSATGRESAKLLEARARIEHRLELSPDDPHWLQLEARSDVLEEKFDPAIDILDRLLAAGPVTSGLLVDDAAAYFQRGTQSGSENDRATALEYLRRADELAPDDPLVLFNEAVAMEDRGQIMNAVETWNRYLRFERDPAWLADGRRRLQALEQKLNQIKSHQSRMEQHLATPQAMRALAANRAELAGLDEELSSSLLPHLLETAYPMTGDRSRASPCLDSCQAARTLLHALADSLERNHQDPWLTELLSAASSSPEAAPSNLSFAPAANALAQAIAADVAGNSLAAQQSAANADRMFHALGNAAGEDRAEVEMSYALQLSSNLAGCYKSAHPLQGRDSRFAWSRIQGLMEDTLCDPAPGTAGENNPSFQRAVQLAHDRHYGILELRARNLLGMAAVDAGDTEAAWGAYLPTVRMFYTGDYPAARLYATLSGLEDVEAATPRAQVALLLQREVMGVLSFTTNRQMVPVQRLQLAAAALRAGSLKEAGDQFRIAETELAANGGGQSVRGFLTENEIAMAKLYLGRHDLAAAAKMLDAANDHMAGESNSYHRRDYAVARGELELAQGRADRAEPLLRNALLEEERLAGKGSAENTLMAQQDRDLYAVLAGVWLAQGRSGLDALSLWERYRLRILGIPAPVCADQKLLCLNPRLAAALGRLGQDQLVGQIVLLDRVLLYRGNGQGVTWTTRSGARDELLQATAQLERVVSSPSTSMDSVHGASRRVAGFLFDPIGGLVQPGASPAAGGRLLLEPDPMLGNLPWPSVETASGPIGLGSNLEESPSLVLDRRPSGRQLPGLHGDLSGQSPARVSGKSLIVGAAMASGESQLLPEVLKEAKAVARFGNKPNVLLAADATQSQVAAQLSTASTIHFAGHASEQDGSMRLLLASGKPGPASRAPSQPYLDSEMLRKHPPRAAQLAVFSACSTGKKDKGWNHGMGDIVDTLASLGVPDVVATRWQIDSAAAVPMMDAFYGGLSKGQSVPQALTGARQTLFRDPRYRHPYYWAAYYASGSGSSDLSDIFHGSR